MLRFLCVAVAERVSGGMGPSLERGVCSQQSRRASLRRYGNYSEWTMPWDPEGGQTQSQTASAFCFS